MQWLLLGVLGFLFFIILLTIIPVYVTISYQRERKLDDFRIELRMLKRVHLTFRVPVIKRKSGDLPPQVEALFEVELPTGSELAGKVESGSATLLQRWEDVSEAMQHFQWVFTILYAFLEGKLEAPPLFGIPNLSVVTASAIRLTRDCRAFTWKTKIGLGDAAATALVAGLLWCIKGGVMTFLGPYIHFHRAPELEVIPDFYQTDVAIRLHCIFRVNVGHIIIVGIRNLAKVGLLKGAKAVGQQRRTQTSD